MATIVFYDKEKEYARNFMEYVSEKKGLPFKIKVFSDMEQLKIFVKEKVPELLIVSEDVLEEDMKEFEMTDFIVLSEGNQVRENTDQLIIYKYQSMENILEEIIDYCVSKKYERESLHPGLRTNIVGIYSPIGRSGKTSFAMTLGQIMQNDGPVLYINMEEFSGFSTIFTKDYRSDLSDLMYYYRQSPESVAIKLKAVVKNFHGIDCVPPMTYSGDIRNVKSVCWAQMIRDIATTGMYESIILDLSNMLSDVFDVLDICDCIYMPLDDDRLSMCKINEYEEFMLRTEREEIMNKTVKIKLPKSEGISWSENYTEQLLWGEMGTFIRKLLKEERCESRQG